MSNVRQWLVDSIRDDGWLGGPVVTFGDFANIIDGNHRYESAKAAGWTDDEIPVITIAELFAERGRDYEAELTARMAERYGDIADADIRRQRAEDDLVEWISPEQIERYDIFAGNNA